VLSLGGEPSIGEGAPTAWVTAPMSSWMPATKPSASTARCASCAVLIAAGVRDDGRRSLLGVSCSLSEAEVHWRGFLTGLKQRGLHGVEMITSDDHEGLKAALRATFHAVAWNHCHFHLQRNASTYVPKVHMRAQVAEDIRSILSAPSRDEAERLLELTVERYAKSASRLSSWTQTALPEGFNPSSPKFFADTDVSGI